MRYSREPPHTDLVLYHTFEDVDIDRVLDYSPQQLDGNAVGDVTFGHTGVVGSAARMKDEQNNIEVNGLDEFLPLDELTSSTWGRSERPVGATQNNVSATATIDGVEYTLTNSVDDEVDGWQYAALTYDGETLRLWYGNESQRPTVASAVDVVGEVQSFDVTVFTSGYGYVDDVRVYRVDGGRDYVNRAYDVAIEHGALGEMADAWTSNALPFRGTNEDLAAALSENFAYTFRTLDAVLEARHIGTAAGYQLERIGRPLGIARNVGERDDHYRQRIRGTMAARRSSGTADDLLHVATVVAETDVEEVELSYQTPSTAIVQVRTADEADAVLSAAEMASLLDDAVPAGHDAEVALVGENAFTIKAEGEVSDADLGLTSDSISTGGTLVADPS